MINAFEQYLRYQLQLSSNTISSYITDLVLMGKELDKPLETLTSYEINDYFHGLSKSLKQSSLSRKMSALKGYYEFLMMKGTIVSNPASLLKVRKGEKKLPKYLTQEEVKQLLDFPLDTAQDYLDKVIIELLYSAGLRVSELISLTVSNYYREEQFLKIRGKGNKERMVPIAKRTKEAIDDYLANSTSKPSTRLLVNSKNMALSRQFVYNRLKKRQEEAGLQKEISPHVLRHSFASALINNEADLRVVQELLGHSSISTTQIYTHLASDSKKNMYNHYHPGQFLKRGKKVNE